MTGKFDPTDIEQMTKAAQALKKEMSIMQENLQGQKFIGESAGGDIKICLDGVGTAVKVDISDQLFEEISLILDGLNSPDASLATLKEKAMSSKDFKNKKIRLLEDLLTAAFNNAKTQLDSSSKKSIFDLTKKIGLN